MSPRVVVSTSWISLDSASATCCGQICSNNCAAWSASSLEPKKPASEVSTIRNGNSAIKVDSAMWLAIAQPSSARNV
jgi:hypothetical protein